MEHLFTYGTLRPSLYPHLAKRFKLEHVADGKIQGFTMWNLGAFPCLVLGADLGDPMIVGEVVKVPSLDAIDRYESYTPDGEGLYDRTEVTVILAGKGGFATTAWVYYMPKLPDLGGHIKQVKSGDWSKR